MGGPDPGAQGAQDRGVRACVRDSGGALGQHWSGGPAELHIEGWEGEGEHNVYRHVLCVCV